MDSKYKVFGCDTDSIIFCKEDGSPFGDEERKAILAEVNSLYPARIRFEDDGYYPKVIVFKAKNYVLYDGKKIKTKGSALKDQKKEKAIKEFQTALIDAVIYDRNNFSEIYHQYVTEIMNLKDIARWSSKKTITNNTMTADGTTQKKMRTAIEGTDYRIGDKCFVFFKPDGSLCLRENFDGSYDWEKLLEKLWKASQLFKDVLPAATFPKYFQKKQQKHLQAYLEKAGSQLSFM